MPNGNYWIDYDGTRYETTWHYARILSDVQMKVIAGDGEPQDVRIQLAGDFDAPHLTVHIGDDHHLSIEPIERALPEQE